MESNLDDFFAEKLISDLDFPCGDHFEYVKNGKIIFKKSLSFLIKYYRNVATETTSGANNICIKVLFDRCINDLLVGFHLANHCYVNQFYSVTRPIFESLDMIALFQKNDMYAKLWHKDSNEFYKKYKPWKIRELIGEPSKDPIYSLFCQLGGHPTSEGANLTNYVLKRNNKRDILVTNFGPSDLIIPIIFAFIFSFLLLLMIAQSIFGFFYEKSREKARKMIKTILENQQEFMNKCIISGFEYHKIDSKPFQDILNYHKGIINNIFDNKFRTKEDQMENKKPKIIEFKPSNDQIRERENVRLSWYIEGGTSEVTVLHVYEINGSKTVGEYNYGKEYGSNDIPFTTRGLEQKYSTIYLLMVSNEYGNSFKWINVKTIPKPIDNQD